jgi:hypothetical protein
MQLTREQLGPRYADFEQEADLASPNEEMISLAPNAEREREAQQRFGRVTGLMRRFYSDELAIFLTTNLHESAEGAAGYSAYVEQEMRDSLGMQVPDGTTILSMDVLSLEGPSANAQRISFEIATPPEAPVRHLLITMVAFTRGPVIALAGLESVDSAGHDAEAQRLAYLLDQQIQRALDDHRRAHV